MFTVTIIWSTNGIRQVETEHPWKDYLVRQTFPEKDRIEYKGRQQPWSSRYMNSAGDILIIWSEGTLD